jgi:hypothetical protein
LDPLEPLARRLSRRAAYGSLLGRASSASTSGLERASSRPSLPPTPLDSQAPYASPCEFAAGLAISPPCASPTEVSASARPSPPQSTLLLRQPGPDRHRAQLALPCPLLLPLGFLRAHARPRRGARAADRSAGARQACARRLIVDRRSVHPRPPLGTHVLPSTADDPLLPLALVPPDGPASEGDAEAKALPPLFSRFQNLLHPDLHPDPTPSRAHGRTVLPPDATACVDAAYVLSCGLCADALCSHL